MTQPPLLTVVNASRVSKVNFHFLLLFFWAIYFENVIRKRTYIMLLVTMTMTMTTMTLNWCTCCEYAAFPFDQSSGRILSKHEGGAS